MLVVPGLGELVGGEVAVGGVRSVDVVVDPPVLDDHLGFEEAVEAPAVEELVAEAAVERFDPPFCQGDPGSMKIDPTPLNLHQSATASAMNSGPLSKRTNAGAPRSHASRSNVRDDPVRVDGTLDHDRGALRVYSSTMLSNLMVRLSSVVSNWKSSAHNTLGAIGHIAPRAVPIRGAVSSVSDTAPAGLPRAKALNPLAVHPPAYATRSLGHATPTPPGAALRERTQELPQRGVVVTWCRRCEPLRRTVLADNPTRSTLRHPEPRLQHPCSIATTVRGQKFPSANSLSIALSSSASASNFFNRVFSTSSSLSRFASLAFIPPYCASQRCHVDSAISRWRHTSSSSAPPARSFWPSRASG